MLIKDIPYHLRNTVRQIDLPIYFEIDGDDCRTPPNLALGDTLMVLGLIRNLGRPVRLHTGPRYRELIQGAPMISELVENPEPPRTLDLVEVPVRRHGRSISYGSKTLYKWVLPVLPSDLIHANPVLAHSLYYKLPKRDDRPGVFVDHSLPFSLEGLLSRQKPNLVIFPFNPGREDSNWQDPEWWRQLLLPLKNRWCVIAVGGRSYEPLSDLVDEVLPMDDPNSSLPALARLLISAHGFIGRDGGLAHLAAGVCQKTVVLWDSALSYRFWACRRAHNILMSNGYGFRYPQALRLTNTEMLQHFRTIEVKQPNGLMREYELPEEGFFDEVRKVYGGLDAFAAQIQIRREAQEDRSGVEVWMGNPKLKEYFYKESQQFARLALEGKLHPEQNLVAPVVP